MLSLNTSVDKIYGIGPKAFTELKKLNILTVKDLLSYFPFRWEDWTQISPVRGLRSGQVVTIKAKIVDIVHTRSSRKGVSILTAVLQSNSDKIEAVWFNQPFLFRILRKGTEWYFHGKIGFFNRVKILQSPLFEKEPQVLAQYHETSQFNSKFFRRIIKTALHAIPQIKDYLPERIIRNYDLMGLKEAVRNIHRPESLEAAQRAKKRLGFDELFFLSLSLQQKRSQLNKKKATACKIDKKLLKDFVGSLPFKLTNAQRKASWQIILDLKSQRPMNRLLQGDVGSGKTVVGLMGALVTADNGHQTVWLAPTEVLARQHFETSRKLLGKRIKIALLTRSQTRFSSRKITKPKLIELIRQGKADLIIATHAILTQDVEIPRLNFLIVDEQHRFGVKQRGQLLGKREDGVHFLSMSATPIPRTLTLTLYGDLDVSILDEVPKDRKKIITKLVTENMRSQTYRFIRQQVRKGRQIFVICPLIEEGGAEDPNNLFDLDRRSVIREYDRLSKDIFPDLKISMLHGKMRPKEKEKIMADFKNGKKDVLVSTAVVEVGIDIPNATIMMIEGAERFGLAQLHQFRGRVGRGRYQSYCFLLGNDLVGKTSRRLKAMEKEDDGFKLAELDLKLRGPGQLAGARQSGWPDLKMASLFDTILVSQAQQAAKAVIGQGVQNYPSLEQEFKRFESERHWE
jgi:ATP-dependent DNA helicase RecG